MLKVVASEMQSVNSLCAGHRPELGQAVIADDSQKYAEPARSRLVKVLVNMMIYDRKVATAWLWSRKFRPSAPATDQNWGKQ